MKKLIIVFLVYIPCLAKTQTLKVGQKLPQLDFKDVLNYNESSFRPADYIGKFIIFDFWNHNCYNCIAAFPKLDSLQKKYKDKLQIILVNSESKDSTKAFFNKRQTLKMPDLPLITGDKILRKLFPSAIYPYSVWINEQSVVNFVTEGGAITDQYIARFISNQNILAEVEDMSIEKDRKSGFRIGNELDLKKVGYYSYISKYIENLSIGWESNEFINSTSFRIRMENQSIEDLYKIAYEEKGKYKLKTKYSIDLTVADSTKYRYVKGYETYYAWSRLNAYNYELMVPVSRKAKVYDYMKEDLNRYFGLDVTIVTKEVPTFALVRTTKEDKLRTKGAPHDYNLGDGVHVPIKGKQPYLVNEDFKRSFISYLKGLINVQLQMPFVDETNYDGKIDMIFSEKSFNPFNYNELIKDLNKYGLDIVELKRPLDVLVIKEPQKN